MHALVQGFAAVAVGPSLMFGPWWPQPQEPQQDPGPARVTVTSLELTPTDARISAAYAGTGTPMLSGRVTFTIPKGRFANKGDSFTLALTRDGSGAMDSLTQGDARADDDGGTITSVNGSTATAEVRYYYGGQRPGSYSVSSLGWGADNFYFTGDTLTLPAGSSVSVREVTRAKIVRHGGRLLGRLSHWRGHGSEPGWHGLRHRTVSVWFRAQGKSRWKQVADVRTKRNGTFALTRPTSRRGHWAVRYDGDAGHAPVS